MKVAHTFQAEGITAGYENRTILHDVSINIPSNKISVLIGANGCGKSTLLKTMGRLVTNLFFWPNYIRWKTD